MNIRILLIPLSLALFGFALLHGNEPTIERMEERLEQEIETLDAERDERLETLRNQYRNGLERRLASLDQSAEANALREELERISNDNPLAPSEPATSGELQRLHEILKEQVEIAEAPRTERLTTLIENLQNFASNHAQSLRRQGRNDDADEWEQWGNTLPARHLAGTGVTIPGIASRFMGLLEAGEEPYLIIVGTSTAEHTGGAVNAPWRQCASGNRSNWPPVLANALSDIGPVRIGGSTCAGVSSREYMSRGRLDWVVEQKPDAVIIEFAAGADCVSRFNMSVEDSRASHMEMIERLLEANPDMEIFLWNGLRSTNQGRRNYWDDRPGQPDFAQLYIDMAQELGPAVFAVDTYSIFQGLYEEDSNAYRTFLRDGNHINRRGGEEVVVPEILRVMKGESE